jgi:hypothetical protein
VLGNTPAPSTSIDACLWDGFHLNSGVKIVGGSGVLLISGEAFTWKPWEASNGERKLRLVNEKGQFDVPDEAWGLLELVWPKPGIFLLYFYLWLFWLCLEYVHVLIVDRFIDSGTGQRYEAYKSKDEATN